VDVEREAYMPRAKTGAVIKKWRILNGKRVKDWYACVSYIDDAGSVNQWTERGDEQDRG
jgi:hypothetical protein